MLHTARACPLRRFLPAAIRILLAVSAIAAAQSEPAADGRSRDRVVRLQGTPEEIGADHGRILRQSIRAMIGDYVESEYGWEEQAPERLQRTRRMKPSLPEWYRRELAACAAAAGIDEDVLLYAQCEGDIRGLRGCTAFVAFGQATPDGRMEIGRNFDYWGLENTRECVVVLAVNPRREDGHAFVSVGWAGILGGWTFFNEKGLFVANNLGGGYATNSSGVPTLILERIIAQKAGSVDDAIRILRETPRMRGQAMVIGQTRTNTRSADAAVVTYDAETVEVTRQTDGFVLNSSIGTNPDDIRSVLNRRLRTPTAAIASAANIITLHSVAIRPQEGRIWVAHGLPANAHRGGYIRYSLEELLRPQP
ncbi:MAG: hypothetical protein JXR77_19640 [Lentisphaeria bacterium]|nr:hypothetical protein [Lentisphaeria bacterium]